MALASFLKVVGSDVLDRVHEGTVRILETTGVVFQLEEALEIFRRNGADVSGKIVKIPRKMLEEALKTAPDSFNWQGGNPERTVHFGPDQARTWFAGNQGPIYIQDVENGRRPGKLDDLANLFKLAQSSPVCDIVGQIPVDPGDAAGPHKHLEIFRCLLRATDKPLMGFLGTREQVGQMFDMLEIVYGREYIEKQPTLGVAVNPLSPLAYSAEPCETIIEFARRKQPIVALTCAMTGVTAPIKLLGAAVMQNAELLAGLVLSQLVSPGAPYVYSPASAVPDMRSAAYITGLPESNLINIVGLQIAREMYHLPTRVMSGLTDSKTVDCQAGLETMQNVLMLVLAGANMGNETLGVLDAIMTTSYEKFIIDEEICDRAAKVAGGLETSDEALSLDVIDQIGPGGSYLMHPSTMKYCRSTWKPSVSFCGSYSDWVKSGSEDIVQRANRKYKERLAGSPETMLSPAVEKDLESYISKQP